MAREITGKTVARVAARGLKTGKLTDVEIRMVCASVVSQSEPKVRKRRAKRAAAKKRPAKTAQKGRVAE